MSDFFSGNVLRWSRHNEIAIAQALLLGAEFEYRPDTTTRQAVRVCFGGVYGPWFVSAGTAAGYFLLCQGYKINDDGSLARY